MRLTQLRWVFSGTVLAVLLTLGCSGPEDSSRGEGTVADRVAAVLDRSGAFQSVRAVVVTVDGAPVFEEYYGSTADDYHDVHSVTKSVMSILIGIAISEGAIAGVDATLADLLPKYAKGMAPQVARTTLEQVLTMTGGFVEEADPEGFAFMGANDPTRAALASAVGPPGQQWRYSDAGAHLMSAILTAATGQTVLDYARARLFDPLDIDTEPVDEPVSTQDLLSPFAQPGFAWAVDNQGLHLGWAHLYLRPADLAKLGYLYLDEGRWHGDQVVPAGWVRATTSGHQKVPGNIPLDARYGYQWWVGTLRGEKAFSAVGFGGQRITVMPNRAAVIVTATQPDVRDPDAGISPEDFSLLADEIAPALREP